MTTSMPDGRSFGARSVREEARDDPPALVHPAWADEFSWLVQGTTRARRSTAALDAEPFDFGLFSGGSSPDRARASWRALAEATQADEVVHARQVHGAVVRIWRSGPDAGGFVSEDGVFASEADVPALVEPCDGHVTDCPGVLLAVSVADCVPVFAVDPKRRAVAMIHAGWRGTAAGVLEAGFASLHGAFGSEAGDLWLHLGPSICHACYEVGTEVYEALDRPVPAGPTPIDLRGVLAERAVAGGVSPANLSISEHCTRCTDSELFSHRGGDAARQVGFLGIRR